MSWPSPPGRSRGRVPPILLARRRRCRRAPRLVPAVTSVAWGDTHLGRDIAGQLSSLVHRQTVELPFPDLTSASERSSS
ncbi:MAG: hypothetical protein QM714_02145 [Nocardioides sp.]|uniref:hypothetical protein n=1 Tax=Nocardioides sp. TaxID=35761 RepID=UPI0039E6FF3F